MMATVDTGIYQNYLKPPKSIQEYQTEAATAESNQLGLQGARINLIGQQQAQADEQALRELYKQPDFNPQSAEGIAKLYRVNPKAGAAAQAALLGAQKTQATIDKEKATAAKTNDEAAGLRLKQYRDTLNFVDTPQGAARWLKAQYDDPITAPQMAGLGSFEQAVTRIPQDPQGFQQWRQQAALGMEKHITAMQTAKRDAATEAHQKATEGLTAHGQNMTATQHAETLAKDYAVAGIGTDGKPSASVEAMAQLIATGKSAPITGFALARPQGQAVMARVAQINPAYDATDYAAKLKAAKDFGTGQQGNAMRSFAVAGQHLDQLDGLVDALNNNDTQLINKIGNTIATQTGSPAPTNFEAVKEIVSKEVIKAIVASGGGVSERKELADLMSQTHAPRQLKEAIKHFRTLMSVQHDALLTQRRAAGLPDSTLPNYAPSGEDIHSQADAILRGK